MLAIRTVGRKLCSDKRGATAIEYGLICALIAVAAIGGMSSLGGGANGMWGRLDNRISGSMN